MFLVNERRQEPYIMTKVPKPPASRFIAYYRVSTIQQGRSGLGLEAQREVVQKYLNGGSWALLAEYVEIESGRKDTRPQLTEALTHCRVTGATLIVAKIDRLARNKRFLESVVEGTGDAGVVFCDLPKIPAGPVGKFLLQQMAAVAELEAGLISERTKAALAAAKARGKKLGGNRGGPKVDPAQGRLARSRVADDYAREVGPIALTALNGAGGSYSAVAAALSARGIRTSRGGIWTRSAVRSLLLRHKALDLREA